MVGVWDVTRFVLNDNSMNCQPDPRVTWLPKGWNQCKNCQTQFAHQIPSCRVQEGTGYEPPIVPIIVHSEPKTEFDPDFDYMGAAKNYQLAKKSGELII